MEGQKGSHLGGERFPGIERTKQSILGTSPCVLTATNIHEGHLKRNKPP